MDLNFELKIGHEFEYWFNKLGEVFFFNQDNNTYHKSDTILMSLHFIMSLTRTLIEHFTLTKYLYSK